MSRDTIVELLLNHGAEVNVASDSGRTALSYACEHRCNDIVDILVKHASVDPDIPDIDGMYKKLSQPRTYNDSQAVLYQYHRSSVFFDLYP